MSMARHPESTGVLELLTPVPSPSPWTSSPSVPPTKTAAVATTLEMAVGEETPPAPLTSSPVEASDYLAERAREATHSTRAR